MIKVSEDVYNQLEELKDKGETYSRIIGQLLEARIQIMELITGLEGQLKFHEWRERELQRLKKTAAERDRA
jgi:predicted CopG family antitoxin